MDNVIDLLNRPINWAVLGAIVATWFLLWHLLLKHILKKCSVTSFWYELYELGAIGILGILIFLSIILLLLIGSIQAVITFGIQMLFPLALFWGGIITIVVLIVRKNLRKKK